MRSPKLRSSFEGGAGELVPAGGSILGILDKVLLAGYTTTIGDVRSSLGWSSPYAKELNIGAYLAGAGTGLMYQFNDDNIVQVYRTAQIKGFESMSSVTEGFGQWGDIPFGKTYSSDVAEELRYSPKWWIIGDSQGFYMMIADHHIVNSIDSVRGRPVIIHYVGDFDSFVVGDTDNAVIVSHNSTERLDGTAANCFCKQSSAYNRITVGGKYYKSFVGDLSGSVGWLTPEGSRPLGSDATPIDSASIPAGSLTPQMTPVMVSDPSLGRARGKMPGLFRVYPSMVGLSGDTFTVNMETFMLFNVAITATTWEQYAVKLNEWA